MQQILFETGTSAPVRKIGIPRDLQRPPARPFGEISFGQGLQTPGNPPEEMLPVPSLRDRHGRSDLFRGLVLRPARRRRKPESERRTAMPGWRRIRPAGLT